MKIEKSMNGADLQIALEGRLDTTTAPELEQALKASLDDANTLTMDFEKLDYISSAGLRVLLATFKQMSQAKGSMELVNVGVNFRNVLKNTGLDAVFGIF